VSSVDTSVDNVDSGSAASGGIVDVSGGAFVLVGNTSKTVWCSGLRLESTGIDLGILLNVVNLFLVSVYIEIILSGTYFW
jgi:hypothetical protein